MSPLDTRESNCGCTTPVPPAMVPSAGPSDPARESPPIQRRSGSASVSGERHGRPGMVVVVLAAGNPGRRRGVHDACQRRPVVAAEPHGLGDHEPEADEQQGDSATTLATRFQRRRERSARRSRRDACASGGGGEEESSMRRERRGRATGSMVTAAPPDGRSGRSAGAPRARRGRRVQPVTRIRIGALILPEHRWEEAAPLLASAPRTLGLDHVWTYDHLAWRSVPRPRLVRRGADAHRRRGGHVAHPHRDAGGVAQLPPPGAVREGGRHPRRHLGVAA